MMKKLSVTRVILILGYLLRISSLPMQTSKHDVEVAPVPSPHLDFDSNKASSSSQVQPLQETTSEKSQTQPTVINGVDNSNRLRVYKNRGKARKEVLTDPMLHLNTRLEQKVGESNRKYKARKAVQNAQKKYWQDVKDDLATSLPPEDQENMYQILLRKRRARKNALQRQRRQERREKKDLPNVQPLEQLQQDKNEHERKLRFARQKVWRQRNKVRNLLSKDPKNVNLAVEAMRLGLDPVTLRIVGKVVKEDENSSVLVPEKQDLRSANSISLVEQATEAEK